MMGNKSRGNYSLAGSLTDDEFKKLFNKKEKEIIEKKEKRIVRVKFKAKNNEDE